MKINSLKKWINIYLEETFKGTAWPSLHGMLLEIKLSVFNSAV